MVFSFVVVIIVSAIFTLIYLSMGVYAYLRDRKSAANRLFPFITLLFANWALAALLRTALFQSALLGPVLPETVLPEAALPFPAIVRYWRLSSGLVWSLGSAAIFHFVLLLTDRGKRRDLHPLVYIPALLLFILSLPESFGIPCPFPALLCSLTGIPVITLWYLVMMTGSTVKLILWGRRSQKDRERIQARLISISLLVTLILVLLYGFILPLFTDLVLPFILPLFPMIWISGMWIAVTRYRFLTFRREIAVREIMNSVLDLVFLTDGDGFIIDLNRQAEQILGFSLPELEDQSIFSLLTMEKGIRGMIHGVRKGEIDAYRVEVDILRRDGTVLPMRIRFSSVLDEQRQVMGLVLAAQDLRMERQFMALSVTDRLTGLANRLKLDEVLDYEILRSRRSKASFSLILLDIDHFKEINDNYGHQQGDLALVELAEILRSALRSSDTVGRWGGEEFMLILPDTEAAEAVVAAEKLRSSIESRRFSRITRLTCTFGVASFREKDSFDSIVNRADQALYAGKDGGRNCVRSETPEPPKISEILAEGAEKN
jgi:diguanylate cyclase (GGDEF)-like protein/PAS domain S-box-containing protein